MIRSSCSNWNHRYSLSLVFSHSHTHTHTHAHAHTHTYTHTRAHTHIHSLTGRVWPLQHICRIAIRRFLGVGRRRRIKELILPKHLISYLCALPVAKSKELHENWDRVKTRKAESVRKRGEARNPKPSRYSPGIHMIRNQEL